MSSICSAIIFLTLSKCCADFAVIPQNKTIPYVLQKQAICIGPVSFPMTHKDLFANAGISNNVALSLKLIAFEWLQIKSIWSLSAFVPKTTTGNFNLLSIKFANSVYFSFAQRLYGCFGEQPGTNKINFSFGNKSKCFCSPFKKDKSTASNGIVIW